MTSFFEAVLRISAEAAVLALLVLGARLIVARRPGLMLTMLYALIAIRLIVPFTVSSPLSVQNIWKVPTTQIVSGSIPINQETPTVAADQNLIDTPAQQPENNPTADTVNPIAAPKATAAPLTAIDIASFVWVAGMIAFSGVMLTGNALFLRRIRRNRHYDTPEFVALLNECKQTLGLKRNIRAICASETGTAAVYGVFRPVLLISPASFEMLTESQQHHVLLHELSHIRRRDTLVCAGATVINIVHWFNPIVWIVFALMRRDIEVQCDAHAFRGLPNAERTDYADTLLKLAGPVHAPTLAPALFISKANIKRRIVMVVKHRRKSALFTAMALLLTVIVAVTGCTTAVDQKVEAPAPEPTPSAVVQADPEVTPAPMPSDYKLIGTYTFDYSTFADDKAIVSNIKKAAALLDGTVMPRNKRLNLSDTLLPLTVENGWSNAPLTISTTTNSNFSEGSFSTSIDVMKSSGDLQVGGGVELVLLAIRMAADKTDVSYLSSWTMDNKSLITDGNFDFKNESNSDVILSVSTENNTITTSLYAADDPIAPAVEPELMSTFTIDNSPAPHDRNTHLENIQIAADMLSGTVIKPGETISLNDILGPRNDETAKTVGWNLASGIKDGSYASNIGTGITAVSTALYNAAIRAELGIVDVKHCSLPYDLVDGGLDATISTGGPDLKISNPYDSDVTIAAKLEGLLLTVSVYGSPMAYTVDFYSEKTTDADEDPVSVYIYDSAIAPDGTEIAPGESYEYAVEMPSSSYTIYKIYYDTDGNETMREIYAMLGYPSVDGVVYVNMSDPMATSIEASLESTSSPSPSPTPQPTSAP